jgi:predicted acyltransferase
MSEHAALATSPDRGTSRLVSLDALRGLTVAAMLLVNNPGSWSHIYTPLAHAPWNGCTLADLVFPFFLFTVGASMAISLERSLARDARRSTLLIQALRRGIMLFALGLGLNLLTLVIPRLAGQAAPAWETLRLLGVLQRIGIVFMIAAAIALYLPRAVQVLLAALILIGYALIIGHAPVDDSTNPAAIFDARILPLRHMYRGGPLDPEGLASTAPAIVTTLCGYWTARWFVPRAATSEASQRLLGIGAGLVLLGIASGSITPVNKQLWTSSYVILTAGAAMMCWALLHHTELSPQHRRGVLKPMVIFGSNAIFAFVASGIVGRLLGHLFVARTSDNTPITLTRWAFDHLAGIMPDPRLASLTVAVITVCLWYVAHRVLHSRGVFFKV